MVETLLAHAGHGAGLHAHPEVLILATVAALLCAFGLRRKER